jgi:hypothetical protein
MSDSQEWWETSLGLGNGPPAEAVSIFTWISIFTGCVAAFLALWWHGRADWRARGQLPEPFLRNAAWAYAPLWTLQYYQLAAVAAFDPRVAWPAVGWELDRLITCLWAFLRLHPQALLPTANWPVLAATFWMVSVGLRRTVASET